MYLSTPHLQSSSPSRPAKKTKRTMGATNEPGQKPKKVNSEIRKQQNRIASRNYRKFSTASLLFMHSLMRFTGEKRKRKLQYLQQLLHDDPAESSDGTSSEAGLNLRSRSVSTEYMGQQQSLDQVPFPPTAEYHVFSSTTGNIMDPIAVTTEPYHSPFCTPAVPFTSYEPSWSVPIYAPPEAPTSTWNGSHWVLDLEFSSQAAASCPDEYAYIPPHTQSSFEHVSVPFSSHEETASNSDLFPFDRSHMGQPQGIPSVSFQSSIPYSQRRFFWAP